MTVRNFCGFTLILLSAGGLAGESAQLAGPVSGYVFDASARGLRPILGVPGSSLLGNPVDFGLEVGAAYVAPGQDAAFVRAAGGTFHLFRLQSGAATEVMVNGLAGAPERVIFSPSGTAAALYRSGSVQIVTGLPASPAIASSLDVSAAGVPGSLALSDDGTSFLLASGRSVELIANGGGLQTLTATAGPALLAFAPGRLEAAVADPAGAGVVLFRNLAGAAAPQVLAAPDNTIQSATALAFTPDGGRVLLANFGAQSVMAFDLAGGAPSSIACSCSPTALARIGNLFRLNEPGRDPLWLLDAQGDSPRLLFVPALGTGVTRQPTPETPRPPAQRPNTSPE